MTGQSSDEKFRLTYEACQKIYIHDLLEILVGHVFCCKCHLSPEWRVGRLSAGCRWMRCFLAGQSCSADRGQRIYTHITAHNSPIRKNTRFTWKIPTLRGSPSLLKRFAPNKPILLRCGLLYPRTIAKYTFFIVP